GVVQLLLEHALVDGRDGPLRPAVDHATHLLGGPEGVLRHRAAGRARDLLGAIRHLVGGAVGALAPLLGPVGVLDGHAHHADRVVHAGDRRDAGDPAPRADDHLAVDAFAHDPVGRADVVLALGRHGGGLQTEAGLLHGRRGLLDDRVGRRAAVLEREVVVLELELYPDHLGV